jgi:hypothetical protein
MNDMFEMIYRDRSIDIAKSMLKDRVTVEFIARHTGLDENTVRELQLESEREPEGAIA